MKYYKLLFSSLFIIILNIALFKSSLLEYFDYKVYDVISSFISSNSNTKSSVVIVDIDEKSLKALGQWPWSRIVLANLIKNIDSAHPSAIGLDIIFAEKDKTSMRTLLDFYKRFFSLKLNVTGLPKNLYDNDKIFASTLKKAGVTLSVFLNDDVNIGYKYCNLPINGLKIEDSSSVKHKANNILCNLKKLQNSAKNIGFINAVPDKDGIFRRVPLFIDYERKVIPILGLATLMSIENIILKKDSIKLFTNSLKFGKNSEVLLKFYDKLWYKKISAVDVLMNRIDKEMLTGKFVLLGTSAVGLYDRIVISNGNSISGVKVHSTLIDNILENELRYELNNSKIYNFIILNLLLGLLLYLMFLKRYILLINIFLIAIFIYSFVSYICLKYNIYLSSAYFLIPFIIGFFIINMLSIIMNYVEKIAFNQEITKAHTSAIDSMALVVESRDTETGAHIKRTKEYIKLLSDYMVQNNISKDILTEEFRELLYKASPMHDIGKVAIPDEILKKPGKLTLKEFEVMKTHATIGKDIIENALLEHNDNKFLKMTRNIAYYHHEKWDGSGYPCGLKGEEIPLEARMMALADVYDSLISRRVYKETLGFELSEKIILDGKGSHFDPVLVDVFVEIKEKFKKVALNFQDI